MIDPELKTHLSALEKELQALSQKSKPWRQFFGGIFYGMGYVTGAVILIVIIGWILNIIGVIPAFNSFVSSFQHALNSINSSSLH